jgi:hypothetical protein
METIRDQKFSGRTFVVDDIVFINCQLKDCDLYFSGGDFEWTNTNFDSCRFHWRGPAASTVRLLQSLGLLRPPDQQQQIPATTAGKPN